jgi:acyl carrier protein
MSDTTRAFLLGVLRDDMNLRVTEDDLGPEVPLGSSGLGLESLDLVELGMQADETLGVAVPDEDYRLISSYTVGEFLDYLDTRLGAAGGSPVTRDGVRDATGRPADPPVTAADIRALLASNSAIALPTDLRSDQEFELDSLGRTWFAHELSQRFGLTVDATDDRLAGATSIDGLTEYVRAALPSGRSRG